MRRIGTILALAAMLLAFTSALWAADEKTVVVKGEGVIFQKDQAMAKEKAIDAALRTAVEQVVGTYIQSHTLVQNYVTVDDKILAQSKGFVKSWRELSSKVEDGVVIVEIEATVKAAELKGSLDEIQWVLSQRSYPRIMLLIAEQNIGQESFSYWWGTTASALSMGQVENTIIDVLSAKGFSFVDPQVLAGKLEVKDAYKVTSAGLSNMAAREIANLTDAQVVITGTAVANDAGPVMEGSKLRSGQADVTVRAINTDNGQILMTASVHAGEAHINSATAGNKALQKAAKKLSEEIVNKLVDKWMNAVGTITVEVSGLDDYKQYEAFKAALAHEVRGVKGVNPRRMQQQTAQLDIYYDGPSSTLANELTSKGFKQFKVKVDEVTSNRVKVVLSK